MPVGPEPGNAFGQGKNVPEIAMAHGIPYVATATVADLRDLEYKVKKAMSMHGARYIQIFVPCPLGWGTASNDTILMARLAKESGMFPVFEAEHGEVTGVLKIRRQVSVEEYMKPQKRFAHLFGKNARPETVARIQALADRNIRKYGLLDVHEIDATANDANDFRRDIAPRGNNSQTCHARFPHLNPLPEGEEANESLREFHVNDGDN
jgi:pyruvate ferredoxin oxidoreductase beta subunit